MKRYSIFIISLLILITFNINITMVSADYSATVDENTTCKLKSGSTGICFYANTSFSSVVSGTYWLDKGDKVTVVESTKPINAPSSGNGSECKTTFSYVKLVYNNKSYYGYACNDNLIKITIDEEIKANFPETYWEKLSSLKSAYPNWTFKPINTNVKFSDAVSQEHSGARSLIQTTNEGYYSIDPNYFDTRTDEYYCYDTCKVKGYNGSNNLNVEWYAANKDTIAYYMDPRNFLDVNYIWMFEDLGWHDHDTVDSVKSVLAGKDILESAETFFNAGRSAKVSPIYLAALAKQETGGNYTNISISGAKFTYNGKEYSGLYNYYNIGATGGSNPSQRGLVWANGGEAGTEKTYSRPWNTRDKAITGGASWIASSYIAKGQSTTYLKKFNVNPNSSNPMYTHQYQTNIVAPKSEAVSTFSSYKSNNLLEADLTFFIPVYKDMPAKTSLPKSGNQNSYLKTFSYQLNEEKAVNFTNFNNNRGANETTKFGFNVNPDIKTITLAGTTANSSAKVTGLGKKTLVAGINTFDVVVTAANGNVRTHTVTIIKDALVEFKVDGKVYDEVIVNYEDKVSAPLEKPKKDGYTFDGWVNEDGTTYDFNAKVTKDTVINAKFTKNPVITFKSNDKVYKTVVIDPNTTVSNPGTPVVDGYIFEYWYQEGTNTSFNFSTKINSDLVIVAKFKKLDGTYVKVSDIVSKSNISLDGTYMNGLTLTTKASTIKDNILKVEPRAVVSFKRNNKDYDTTENVKTGDTITITSGNEIVTYTVVIYGDLNADGSTNALDLLKVQKHILGVNKLSGAYLKAADVNRDGSINALDLLKVQKHILGVSTITQK